MAVGTPPVSHARARAAASRDAAQEVRFCRGADGVRLAYAVHGDGPRLLVVSCWLSHLQHDWQSPVWRHFLEDLGGIATVARYDERGFGMSDWSVTDFSLDARLADLEAVVESLGWDRFALLGMSGGAPVAIAYAARHPDRVSRFALYGGIADGRPTDSDAEQAFRAMIRAGWARPDPIFRRVFTSIFIPDATEDQMGWLDDLQRMSTSTENAVTSRIARKATDVSSMLPELRMPTLVLHARGDRAVRFEEACRVAAEVPGARLVPLESRNHILLEDEPAWEAFVNEMRAFLAPEREVAAAHSGYVGSLEDLSPRELDVLRSAAQGLANDEIASSLGLSVRTVERHLSNVYGKLGLTGRAARTAAVAELLRRRFA